jgi:transcription-repair coupling factor (superfamily II helicase)
MKKRYFGLQGSSKAWLTSKIYKKFQSITVICKNRKIAEQLFSDVSFFVSGTNLLHFPPWDTLPFEPVSPQTHISAMRLYALSKISSAEPYITVTSIEAISQKVIPKSITESLRFNLMTGAIIARRDLLSKLEINGFQRVSLVEEVGDMAVRGGVIDFFPNGHRHPVRLEFLADKIEKIKSFDVATQRSLEPLQNVEVIPVREIINFSAAPECQNLLPSAASRIKQRGRKLETPPREVAKVLSAIKEGRQFPGLELIMPIALEEMSSYFQYLHNEPLIILDDEIGIYQELDAFWELIHERQNRLSEEHYLIPENEDLFLLPAEIKSSLSEIDTYHMDQLEVFHPEEAAHQKSINLQSVSNTELKTRLETRVGTGKALEPLTDIINRWRNLNFHIAFIVGSKNRAERLQRQLLELNFDGRILDISGAEWCDSPNRYPMVILEGHLVSGFQLPNEGLVFISENEIFSQRSYRSHKSYSERHIKRLLSSLSNLKQNEYVVHEDYGIGLYQGLVHLQVEGAESDFLHIDYADSRLYLPVQNIGKLQKYFATEGQTPALDKLGSKKWIKTKEKIRESIVTLAGDLIQLYATRSVAKGWRFDDAGAEDERFADEFPYDETPDQTEAINDTLGDMATDKPMDRLICGDVGFGKTEVAIRAAYKSIQHARQVAVLVPTTILVEQHKVSFKERFEGYPVEIGVTSRFYSAKQNKETLQLLQEGKIDIIIGTHKLLQKNIQFKDLGLLIIDEEHRFGVKQKETLKQMKKQVDVLTLTATPIPRTLHMSLLDIRDVSVISTPPHDRRLIRTYVATRNDTIIRDALLREYQRGGQSFFLHNRVQSIDFITHGLRELVPEVSFEYAHGQMSEVQLESIMRRFINGEIDVLVCTTIIESGVDIPNVNTIIIDRAHQFGLAQLYQLRGRVGRSTRQAYAYLLIPPARRLGSEAQKRLKVLQSLDDLGQGFNLALRDLEIRGAGNLLGREQSGNVCCIGYELYTKILKEAILNLKGEELDLEESIDPEVKLGISAYIPDSYIPDVSERLVMYQRLAAVISSQETNQLALEIEDRFGCLGDEVKNLIEVMRIRGLLRTHGVVKADYNQSSLSLSFSPRASIDLKKILELQKQHPERYKFGRSLSLNVLLDQDRPLAPVEIYQLAKSTLEKVSLS